MKFIPFVTAGYPNPSLFKKIVFILEQEGADMIEIGVPYSDPLADGPVIQQASLQAIDQGMNLSKTLELIEQIRAEGLKTPLVLFTYYNPILRFGLNELAKRLAEIGVDGVLVPDLPLEEGADLKNVLTPYQIPVISLIAPTSIERVKAIAEQAEGFIYIVSSLGVTGERSQFHQQITSLIKEVKQVANVPVALGFGIKKRSQINELKQDLDGYVIGSALVRRIGEIFNLTDEGISEEEQLELFSDYVKEVQS